MSDLARLLDLIEAAIHDDPYCPACGAPTDVRPEGDQLWLVCTTEVADEGLLARIRGAFVPHIRREVLDLALDWAA